MDDIDQYYEIFDLKPGASLEELKRAYRDLVRVWHPDRFSHDLRLQQKAQEKLKEINEAYEKLQAFLSGHGARASRPRSRPSQSRPHGESGEARSGDSRAAPEPPPEAERTRENSKASSAGIWAVILTWLRYEYELMPTAVKIGVIVVLLLIVITFTQNSRSKQTAPEPVKTPVIASAPKSLSELQGTVSKLGRKASPEHQATRLRLLVDRYPKLAAFAAKARAEGYSDQEIDDFVREKFIVPALKEGYNAQEINEYLGWKEAPARKKATAKLETPRAGGEHSVSPRLPSGYFTIGSTKDEVLAIQGTPDRFTERSLHYGTSDVFFRDGRVVSWYNGYPKLKVRMLPTSSTDKSYFTVGSTKDEVLAIQGTPDRFTDRSFHYGTSDVFFQNSRVVSWYNGYPKLRVRMLPATSTDKGYFTVDSTKDEVLAIQGTPDRFTERSLHYGTSDVFFKDGRVSSWYNGYPKLRVRMLPSSGTAGKSGPTPDEELRPPDS